MLKRTIGQSVKYVAISLFQGQWTRVTSVTWLPNLDDRCHESRCNSQIRIITNQESVIMQWHDSCVFTCSELFCKFLATQDKYLRNSYLSLVGQGIVCILLTLFLPNGVFLIVICSLNFSFCSKPPTMWSPVISTHCLTIKLWTYVHVGYVRILPKFWGILLNITVTRVIWSIDPFGPLTC